MNEEGGPDLRDETDGAFLGISPVLGTPVFMSNYTWDLTLDPLYDKTSKCKFPRSVREKLGREQQNRILHRKNLRGNSLMSRNNVKRYDHNWVLDES